MGRRYYDQDELPDDADELRAEDRARSRAARCPHRDGDPDCLCHPEEPEPEED